jgi:hypothetical protein
MSNSHDRAAKLIAKKLCGKYNRTGSPDVKGRRGSAEVKSTAEEIPQALRQLSGPKGPAYIALPEREQNQAVRRLARLKTGLMNYQGKVLKSSTRKK